MEDFREAIYPIDQPDRDTTRNSHLAQRLPQLNLARRVFNQLLTESEPL